MTLLALAVVFLFVPFMTSVAIVALAWIWRRPNEPTVEFGAGSLGASAELSGSLDSDTFIGPAGWPPKPAVFYDQERDDA